MCGISGWFKRNGAPVDAALLRVMTDRLVHRGPDDSGLWADGNIGLGHRRLSIRDLSAAGHQPMSDPGGRIVVTYNGEIYNDAELRRQLESGFGYTFRTHTDTELLPLGYLAWGEGLFDRLEGMFAIGLWDRQEKRLILARDGIGIKPLYYYADDESVIFASEVKALLASTRVRASLDPATLHTFLAAGYPGPGASLLKGVRQVRPGSYAIFTSEESFEHTFWKPQRTGEITKLDAALEEICALLPDVVRSQLVSDVPIGVLQSGGIDSTLVSLSLRQLNLYPPLFTAGFREASYDESDLARQVASRAGLSPPRVLQIEDDPDPVQSFRAMAYHFDGQCADTGSYAFYRLCGEIRKHTTVVLSGDGGDEFFAGYSTYRASRVASRLQPWLASALLGAIGRGAYRLNSRDDSRLPMTSVMARFALGLAAGGQNAHAQWRRLVPEFMLRTLYGPELKPWLEISPYTEYEAFMRERDTSPLDGWMLADQQFHLQSVLSKVDAMSMAHSLEVRVPLLDRRMMNFAGRCNTNLLAPKSGPLKFLLRKAAAHLGAPETVLSAKKMGFNVPIARMLRHELAPLANYWLEQNPDVLSPFLQPGAIRSLWREHHTQRANHAFALWPILTLAEWLGTNP
jgi:asparagine synthase (glutamine-hydrolysing)